MSIWGQLLFRKKYELCIRLAIAARHLHPGDNASPIDRAIYRRLSRLGEALFLRIAQQIIINERVKMAQEDCKHDKAGVDATFCPECGKQLGADAESSAQVERIVRKVLSEFDVKPKAKPKGEGGKGTEGGKQTLAERLNLKK